MEPKSVGSSPGVVVVGAGPYGLSAAAHLREAGLDTHVLGDEMAYWRAMPRGMLLRSPWRASSISSPQGSLSLAAFETEQGVAVKRPVPLADFVRYGEWFQQRAVPDLDRRRVEHVHRDGAGFRLELADGNALGAARVVMATGLDSYAHIPDVLRKLPVERVSHTADVAEPGLFAGRRVLVVGGGQSAIETAALIHQAGADLELVMRKPQINWLTRSARLHSMGGRLNNLLYPDTDVGPPGLSQIVARPRLFQLLPYRVQRRIAYRCIRPAASDWLQERMRGATITTGRSVASARLAGDAVVVGFDDGSEREIDHVLAGTGYRLDVRSHPLLAPELAQELKVKDGYPQLGRGYESSIPGLHFVGALSAVSYGPVMRFVSGTKLTGPELTNAITTGRDTGSTQTLPQPEAEVRADASRAA